MIYDKMYLLYTWLVVVWKLSFKKACKPWQIIVFIVFARDRHGVFGRKLVNAMQSTFYINSFNFFLLSF